MNRLLLFQFSATLQSEEIVTEECRKKSKDTPMIIPYSNHDEVCLHTCKSHISIPIPLTATPGFSTDLGLYMEICYTLVGFILVYFINIY